LDEGRALIEEELSHQNRADRLHSEKDRGDRGWKARQANADQEPTPHLHSQGKYQEPTVGGPGRGKIDLP
jgi:hypothetical protein